MVVTKEDMIPLFHHTYQGNMNDSKVFREVLGKIKSRMVKLGLDIEKHTVIFDRGNNSKSNLNAVEKLGLHYVGALTPYHHKKLINQAETNFEAININENEIQVYRDKLVLWGNLRTVVVFISENLKSGQIRGLYQSLEKIEKELRLLQEDLINPKAKKRDKEKLEHKIMEIIEKQFIKNLINWSLIELSEGRFQLEFSINNERLNEIEGNMGFRILMTDRHTWSTYEIIKAYYGQSKIEHSFKNLKNPYHLTLKPQFHWTDQKIRVHFFICILGYLLSAIIWHEAKTKAKFKGSLDSLLDALNNVRLATILENTKSRGKIKAYYKLEEMTETENQVIEALEIKELHNNRIKFHGVGIYNTDNL